VDPRLPLSFIKIHDFREIRYKTLDGSTLGSPMNFLFSSF